MPNEKEGSVQRTVVHIDHAAMMRAAVATALVALIWFALAAQAFVVGGLSHYIILPIALALTLFFGWFSFWALRRNANDEPAMIIDELGIFDNVSLAKCGRARWSEMERVWIGGPKWMQVLCIRPENAALFIEGQEESRRWIMSVQNALIGAPIVIPLHVVNTPGDDLWNRVVELASPKRSAGEGPSSSPVAGA